MTHTIDKNIPIPPDQRGRRAQVSIFKLLEVGDSVLFESRYKGNEAWRFKRENKGWNYTSRKEGTGVRIWRIA